MRTLSFELSLGGLQCPTGALQEESVPLLTGVYIVLLERCRYLGRTTLQHTHALQDVSRSGSTTCRSGRKVQYACNPGKSAKIPGGVAPFCPQYHVHSLSPLETLLAYPSL